jgi:hypothetical protein
MVWYYRSGDANGLTTEHTRAQHPPMIRIHSNISGNLSLHKQKSDFVKTSTKCPAVELTKLADIG